MDLFNSFVTNPACNGLKPLKASLTYQKLEGENAIHPGSQAPGQKG
jgi:hypothetical protein